MGAGLASEEAVMAAAEIAREPVGPAPGAVGTDEDRTW